MERTPEIATRELIDEVKQPKPSLEQVSALLSDGADPNAVCDNHENTLVHCCAREAKLTPVLDLLLKTGKADLKRINKSGEQPLHRATYHKNLAAVKLLVNAGADVNAFSMADDHEEESPLFLAMIINHNIAHQKKFQDSAEIIRFLREHGAWRLTKNGDEAEKKDVFPLSKMSICLHDAFFTSERLVITRDNLIALFESRPNVSSPDPNARILSDPKEKDTADGFTILHYLVFWNKQTWDAFFPVFLSAGLNVNLANYKKNTALHELMTSIEWKMSLAERQKHHLAPASFLFDLFINHADPLAQNQDGNTPLHLAAEQGNFKAYVALWHMAKALSTGENDLLTHVLNQKNNAGKTAAELLDAKIGRASSKNVPCQQGNILHWAVIQDDLDVFKKVWDYLVTTKGLEQTKAMLAAVDENGRSPLHALLSSIIFNLRYNIDVNLSDRLAVLRFLLQHGADPCSRDREGCTALHYALAIGDQPIIDALLQNILNQFKGNILGEDFKKFLTAKPTVDSNSNKVAADSVIESALKHKASWFLATLMHAGIDIPTTYFSSSRWDPASNKWVPIDRASGNILHWASLQEDKVSKPIWNNIRPEKLKQFINEKDSAGNTPFHLALQSKMNGDESVLLDTVNFYLDNGADPNIPNKDGKTLLYRLLEQRKLKAAEALCKHEKFSLEKELAQADQDPPLLHLAAQFGCRFIFKKMKQTKDKKDYRAILNKKDKGGWTVLETIPLDCIELYSLLLELGAEHNVKNMPALLVAITSNQQNNVKICLERGDDPHRIYSIINGTPFTPLSHALDDRQFEYVPMMLYKETYDPKQHYDTSPFAFLCTLVNLNKNEKPKDLLALRSAVQLNQPTLIKSLLALSVLGVVFGLALIGYAASIFFTAGASIAFLPALTPLVINLCAAITFAVGLIVSLASGYEVYKKGHEVHVIHQAETILAQHQDKIKAENPLQGTQTLAPAPA